MSNELKLSSPVEIKDNSEARVALDLMLKIADTEFEDFKERSKKQKDRLYWLRLYDQCKRIVGNHSYTAESAVKSSLADKDAD